MSVDEMKLLLHFYLQKVGGAVASVSFHLLNTVFDHLKMDGADYVCLLGAQSF